MSGISLQKERIGDAAILHVNGRITLGEASIAVRDAIRALTAEGADKVILDLANVSYIDSAGIGELVSAYTHVRNAGGSLALVGLTKRVSDLLEITRLRSVFPIYDSVSAAVSAVPE